MKIKVNGIKREVQIMQAPQGSFCYDEDGYELQFPIYIGMCEPVAEGEERRNVLVFPINGEGNNRYEGMEPQYIMNDVSLYDLQKLIVRYTREYICDNLKDVVEEIMDLFEIHKTPITLSVRKYVDDVMNGVITEIPTRV